MTAGSSIVERLRAAVTDPREPAAVMPDGLRPASVLLLCDPSTEGVPLLFVLRSEELREHPGQIAFPGGGAETFDSDVVATALREAGEELGIASSSVQILGLLTPFSTVVSGRWLTPVVGLQREPIEFRTEASRSPSGSASTSPTCSWRHTPCARSNATACVAAFTTTRRRTGSSGE